MRSPFAALMLITVFSCAVAFADDEACDPTEIAATAGFPVTPGSSPGAVRIDAPRASLKIAVAGVRVTPALGLSARAAFTGTKTNTIVIGDVPLLEGEVNRFLLSALDAGLDVTSLHNRFIQDQPRVMSLHFQGTGPEHELASAVGRLFKTLGASASTRPKAGTTALDLNIIHQFLWKGELEDGVYRVSTGRGTVLDGVAVGQAAGVSSWSAFSGTTANAMVNGDMACLEYELKDVLRALAGAHFSIMSIHTHLVKETPRVMFVHYWGKGKLIDLAKGVRAALDQQQNFRGSR